MLTKTKQFIISFSRPNARHQEKASFFSLAKKHIVKGKKSNRRLSKEIDEIVYGI